MQTSASAQSVVRPKWKICLQAIIILFVEPAITKKAGPHKREEQLQLHRPLPASARGVQSPKGASEFHSDKSQPGGLASYCKLCKSLAAARYSQKYQTELAATGSATCTVCNKVKPANQMRLSEPKCLECHSEFKKAYDARRYTTDEHFRLSRLLRGRVLEALKGNDKSQRTLDLLGCTIPEFRQYHATIHHRNDMGEPGIVASGS